MNRFASWLMPALVALTLGISAAPAAASFHLVQVREVYPGSAANPDSEYVELQMWSAGQNFVGGHFVRIYDASGGVIATSAFAANVPNGADQSTLLLATPAAESQFGVAADSPLASGKLSAGGGAVCWEAIDCASWGSFAGSLPSPAGPPAVEIPDGMALGRSIGRDCATTLDPADDQNDSGADFSSTPPAPRPNSIAPSERPCTGTGEGSGNPSLPGGAPETRLRRKPPKRTIDRTPTFRFSSDVVGVHFECKVDGKRYRPCRSPLTVKRLSVGAHRFLVRAVDHDGAQDPTPAAYRFRVIRS